MRCTRNSKLPRNMVASTSSETRGHKKSRLPSKSPSAVISDNNREKPLPIIPELQEESEPWIKSLRPNPTPFSQTDTAFSSPQPPVFLPSSQSQPLAGHDIRPHYQDGSLQPAFSHFQNPIQVYQQHHQQHLPSPVTYSCFLVNSGPRVTTADAVSAGCPSDRDDTAIIVHRKKTNNKEKTVMCTNGPNCYFGKLEKCKFAHSKDELKRSSLVELRQNHHRGDDYLGRPCFFSVMGGSW